MKNDTRDRFLSFSVRPWGILRAAGTVACAATLFGFLGRYNWFLDLFSHFRVQYLIALAGLGVVFLITKKRRTGAIFLVFAFINLCTVAPLYSGGEDSSANVKGALRAVFVNVNTGNRDADRVRQYIRDVEPDIVVLEEINGRWMADLKWLAQSYPHSRIEPREDNFGIGLFSKLPLVDARIVYIGDAEVPSVIARVESDDGAFAVIATHPVPPAGARYSQWRNSQLEQLPEYLPTSLPALVLGDLNVTPWNYHFRRLLKRSGLKDSSRGRGIQPTWPSFNVLVLIPVDHCLHSSDICVLNREIGPDVGSDHYPVVVDFALISDR